MSVEKITLRFSTEKQSVLEQTCALCASTGEYACIGHCEVILCTQCTSRHHSLVIQQMRELLERLKIYQKTLVEISKTKSIQLSTTSEIQVNITIESNSTTIESDYLLVYLKTLEEYIQINRLLDAKILADLDARLHKQTAFITGKLPPVIIPDGSHSPRPRRPRTSYSRAVTVSLNGRKHFQLPIQSSFSIGQHPIVVTLIDHYLETSFFQWRNNSVILLSTSSIDVYARGSSLIWSIPMTRVLGNIKDRILAGTWCAYIQRLILVGQYHFYIFDIDRQKVRCVCDCGCGGRCGSGPMRPKERHYITPRFRCQSAHDAQTFSQRFLTCTHDGHVFYAYKSSRSTYSIEVYHFARPFSDATSDWYTYDTFRISGVREIRSIRTLTINHPLAAMCITHDRLALIYRHTRRTTKISTTIVGNSYEIDHYFVLLDHSLKPSNVNVQLSPSIRWATAIMPYGNESEYLICDPRGQQLLLYHAVNNNLLRRFHIGPVNACCLNDGRLVLWIQKSYASSPIGKLHFISAPHLEKYSPVATSCELLKLSYK